MSDSTIALSVKTRTFLDLVDFLRRKGSDRDPVEVVDDAIRYWVDNAEWKEEDLMPGLSEHPAHIGYIWKRLLLPPGTRVRMTYRGTTHHAVVEGDDFIGLGGRKMSPSEFANEVAGGTARNAWRDLWIKRPSDWDFRLADELRRGPQKRIF